MFVSCVAVAVPAGCADDSTHTTPNVADTVAVSTTIPVSTTTVVADTTGPASDHEFADTRRGTPTVAALGAPGGSGAGEANGGR